MAIRPTYLQWVSAADYPTVEDFVSEVKVCGVSRRLPCADTAAFFAEHRPAVFLVHGGQRVECLACAETIICPECNGRALDRHCERCMGLGSIEQGTGGHAVVDGEKWPYRRYMALKRIPKYKLWHEQHEFGEVVHCQTCGGRGWLSRGGVFGFFVPDRIDYILRPREAHKRRQWLGRKNVRPVTAAALRAEKARAGGKRAPGSYYAVTSPPENSHKSGIAEGIVDDLVDLGSLLAPALVNYYGGFVHFFDPIPRVSKAFRGLKRFHLDDQGEGLSTLEGVE